MLSELDIVRESSGSRWGFSTDAGANQTTELQGYIMFDSPIPHVSALDCVQGHREVW